MPELPEVQTVVEYLKKISLSGKIIHSIHSPNEYEKVCNNSSLAEFSNFLQKKQIKDVFRRGKYIIMELNTGFLLFHLRMTGKLINELKNKIDLKYVSLQINFQDGSKLFFRDTRKFGQAYICKNLNWLEERLGIEPLSQKLNPNWLYSLFKSHNRMVKALLLDQQFIAGLGNIYIDEALWHARIHPKSISSKIKRKNVNDLCTAIKATLQNAIIHNGTTMIDFSYGNNRKGSFSNELKVFNRTNEPCLICNTSISKIFVVQRGTHYCKECQRV